MDFIGGFDNCDQDLGIRYNNYIYHLSPKMPGFEQNKHLEDILVPFQCLLEKNCVFLAELIHRVE